VKAKLQQMAMRAIAKAARYERYARLIGDQETARSILELASKLRRRAETLGEPSENRIRRRARQIWIENGRPSSRDEEFWLMAERELTVNVPQPKKYGTGSH
jgi:hypothetical protein